MRPRDTVEMQGFELVAIFVATSDLQNIFQGPLRAPQEPSGVENWSRDPWVTPLPPARQIVPIFIKDSGQKCLGHCKYEAILAVAFHLVKMDTIWPAALVGALSGRPRSRKQLFKKASQLRRLFFETFLPSTTWSRDTVNMERICLASLFEATSAFQILGKSALEYFSALFDVVTGHRKYGVILCGWTFLIFKTFSTWPRGTVNMEGIELSAFCSLPSCLCSLLAAFGHAV